MTKTSTLPMRIRLSDGTTGDIEITTTKTVTGRITEKRSLTRKQRDELAEILKATIEQEGETG